MCGVRVQAIRTLHMCAQNNTVCAGRPGYRIIFVVNFRGRRTYLIMPSRVTHCNVTYHFEPYVFCFSFGIVFRRFRWLVRRVFPAYMIITSVYLLRPYTEYNPSSNDVLSTRWKCNVCAVSANVRRFWRVLKQWRPISEYTCARRISRKASHCNENRGTYSEKWIQYSKSPWSLQSWKNTYICDIRVFGFIENWKIMSE